MVSTHGGRYVPNTITGWGWGNAIEMGGRNFSMADQNQEYANFPSCRRDNPGNAGTADR